MERVAEEKQKKCFVFFGALDCSQTYILLRIASSEGGLHLAGLENNTVLEFIFSASTANLAGVMSPKKLGSLV